MDSVIKDTTVTQNAGSKTYSSWGAWSISLSANVTTIAAAGGNATLSTSATRSRTWQWNGTGTTYTENASGSPTLSKVNGAASLSGSIVSYGNNTSTSSRSSVFRATIDSATKDITINQSAGSKSYGSWSSWSVYCNASSYTVAASGGSVTIYYGASRSRTWTWNGVAGSGGTETENATPSLSAESGGGTLSGSTLSYSNNTSISVRRTRVTANYNGAINFCDIEQRAGSKVYGSWSGWSVSISASPTNIAAAGGSSTITCSAVRSRQYTWNGVGQNFPETENGNPTLSKSGDGTLSGTTSGSKLTYGNRTATTSRSTTVTATYSEVSKSINITQSAGVKTNITSSTKVLFLHERASNYVEAINNSVYINNARDNNGNRNGAVICNIRFKIIITESYKWNNVGNVISSESYGSINFHKNISLNTTTLLYKDTDNSYYGSFSIISKATADEEEYSAEYITNNNIIITLYVRRPRLYWQVWCNEILEQKDEPFIVNVNKVTRTKLYNNNTITEGCAGSDQQYLYLFSTSNMMASSTITVKLIRNNNPNDACKLTSVTNTNTHTKTNVSLEEDKTVIKTFVTSYLQTLPIDLCKVTFKYAELNFRIFIAKGTGH